MPASSKPQYKKYADYAVWNQPYSFLPMLYINESGIPFTPVFPYRNTDPLEAFAIWWRVITFYLNEDNWRYVFDNKLFISFEKSIFEILLKFAGNDAIIAEYCEAFNHVVSQYNTLREEQMIEEQRLRKYELHVELCVRHFQRTNGSLATA